VASGLDRCGGRKGVVVVPARVHRDDIGLALAEHAGRGGPAAELDIAGAVELVLVVADQRFEVAGGEPRQGRLVPARSGPA
jgi:hypothetical protein